MKLLQATHGTEDKVIIKLLNEIDYYIKEANNPKLDGWNQNYYRERLKKIKEKISSIDEELLKLHGE